jgi:hypothetical protein
MQHHAYIYEGSQELLGALVEAARKEFNFEGDNNPDLHVESYEKFGIDDAHELTRDAQLKSVSGRSLFILGIASINTHAQQALLKLFEEPQEGIIFVLLVPHGILLPTLRSRLMPYPETQNFAEEKSKLGGQNSLARDGSDPKRETRGPFEQQVSTFLKSPYKARSAQIAALLKDEENTKERVRDFVNALEAQLYDRLRKSVTKEVREGLEDIAKVRGYLADQSPSLKMLLEHLAATLPAL